MPWPLLFHLTIPSKCIYHKSQLSNETLESNSGHWIFLTFIDARFLLKHPFALSQIVKLKNKLFGSLSGLFLKCLVVVTSRFWNLTIGIAPFWWTAINKWQIFLARPKAVPIAAEYVGLVKSIYPRNPQYFSHRNLIIDTRTHSTHEKHRPFVTR